MAKSSSYLRNKSLWTIGAYAGSAGIRFMSNVVLSRLLSPEIFGIMTIIYTIRVGIELLTDVGIEHNIIRNEKSLTPTFYNTAWTLQIIRGVLMTTILLAAAPLLGASYNIETMIFICVAFWPFLNSLHSTSIYLLVKTLEVKRRNLFELGTEALTFLINVTFAFFNPTVWALVFGMLVSGSLRSALSFLLPHARHKLMIDRQSAKEILSFGKWIFISSLVFYASTFVDKIYFSKVASLELLGIYGIAKTISDLPAVLAQRLSTQIFLPVLSALRTGRDEVSLAQLRTTRRNFLLMVAAGIAGLMASSDWAVHIVYQPRYYDAAWMLVFLLFSSWFCVVSNSNESILLGLGQPAYTSAGNLTKLIGLIVSLPIAYYFFGIGGAIAVLPLSEICRFAVLAFGQYRIRLSTLRQDLLITACLLLAFGGLVALRVALGWGVPWEGFWANVVHR